MTRSPTVALLLAALGGCAAAPGGIQPPRGEPPPAAAGGIECQLQHVTGELIAARVCTLKEQRDAIKRSTQDARDFLDRQVIAACPGTPGCKN